MKIFLILITLIIATNLFAETNPPKVTTQQFQNWTYQCVEDKKTKTCEVSQNIRIQNSNINFSVVYNKFLNQDKETKKSISIIAPLGVDLNTQLALRFDGKEQINLRWSTCEQIGTSSSTSVWLEAIEYKRAVKGRQASTSCWDVNLTG